MVYIYKLDPIIMLNYSNETKQNVLNVYTEFLREMNLDFQILVVNNKMDINKYLNRYTSNLGLINNELLIDIYTKYIEDIRKKICEEKIYETKYYIIVAIRDLDKSSVENVDNIIFKFKRIGCNVHRIIGKENYQKILYECINNQKNY